MLVTKIQVEDEQENKHDLVFSSGTYEGNQWIDMVFEGRTYCLELDDIMPALIAFDARKARGKEDNL